MTKAERRFVVVILAMIAVTVVLPMEQRDGGTWVRLLEGGIVGWFGVAALRAIQAAP